MRASHEFLLGLLDRDEAACVAREDIGGPHGPALRLWQEAGLMDRAPGSHAAAGCPWCNEGEAYPLGERLLCRSCRSVIDPCELHVWRLHLPALLGWVAGQWGLRGGVRRIDARLWQLGTLDLDPGQSASECFYRRSGPLLVEAERRLAAYQRVIVLHGSPLPDFSAGPGQRCLFLPSLLAPRPPLALIRPEGPLRQHGPVRFDREAGILWAGDERLGEVPVGSKEWAFLDCLAGLRGRFVSYADIKRDVLHRTGSRDSTEEATFCHRLKSRIKRNGWVPKIDLLLATTNKAVGYRLRGEIGP